MAANKRVAQLERENVALKDDLSTQKMLKTEWEQHYNKLESERLADNVKHQAALVQAGKKVTDLTQALTIVEARLHVAELERDLERAQHYLRGLLPPRPRDTNLMGSMRLSTIQPTGTISAIPRKESCIDHA